MTFVENESGAVTVDWVVLTAGLVGLGLATMGVVSGGVEDAAGDTRDQMTDQAIYTSFAQAATPAYYDAVANFLDKSPFHDGNPDEWVLNAIADLNEWMDEAPMEPIEEELDGFEDTALRHQALDALSVETLTRSDLAAALNMSETDLQYGIDTYMGGDMEAYFEHTAGSSRMQYEYGNLVMDLADERGIDYSDYYVR